ncbi:MAG: hypothetical protein WCY67_02910 [Acidithiobacillus sp.]
MTGFDRIGSLLSAKLFEVLLMALVGGFSAPALAQSLDISALRVTGPNWQIQHLQMRLQTADRGNDAMRLQAGALQAGKKQIWKQAQIHCLVQTQQGWSCQHLQMALVGTPWGALRGAGGLSLLRVGGTGAIGVRITGAQFGRAAVQMRSAPTGQWQLRAHGNLPLGGWVQAWRLLPANWQSAGDSDWQVDAQGADWTQADTAHFLATLTQGAFSSPDGLQAAQNVAAQLQGDGQYLGRWRGHIQLRWTKGGVLWSPWYWAAPDTAIEASSHWQQTATSWQLDDGRIHWPDLGQGRFGLIWPTTSRPLAWRLQDVQVAMGPLYSIWVKPLLPATGLATQAQVTGHLRFSVAGANGLQALQWNLQDANFDAKPLTVKGVNSIGSWRQQMKSSSASLSWRRANLYRIPLGPVAAQLVMHPGGFALQHALGVKVLGGTLKLQHLTGRWAGADSGFTMRGSLQGLSMTRLTQAMHWPPFTGTIAADIPDLTYHAGNIRTSGNLSAEIFGGRVQVNDLKVDHFLGVMPLLRANMTVHDLQLKPLTDAFHFGYISGVLQGEVHHLYLLNWSPETFQARFATVKTPDVSQKISYQAVQSITKLGGGDGISGFFQGMFLRLYKTFNYAHLGLGIDLKNGVAELSGVKPENGGFLILQGQGLPRVDIVGYNRRVDWEELLARLKIAMQTGAQVKTGE